MVRGVWEGRGVRGNMVSGYGEGGGTGKVVG